MPNELLPHARPKSRLDALVKARYELSWSKARDWVSSGKIWLNGAPCIEPGYLVGADTVLELKMNTPRAVGAAGNVGGSDIKNRAGLAENPRSSVPLQTSEVVFLDTQIVVVNKAAGVNSVPYDETERDSLEQKVGRYLKRSRVVVVHRLDRETSGLLVFARTPEAGKALAQQFRFHTVQRRYVALAQGQVRSQTIRSFLVENRGDGLRGSIGPHELRANAEAKEAITHVKALHVFEGYTLIECRLETGRTHQIRIHLGEAGHPLLGEKAYDRDYRGNKIPAPRLMLHAAELGFEHPTKKIPMSWRLEPPVDFMGFLDEAARAAMGPR